MAVNEIEKFVWKFRQYLVAGSRAGLTLNCENGHAWVNMSVDLGPWRPPLVLPVALPLVLHLLLYLPSLQGLPPSPPLRPP